MNVAELAGEVVARSAAEVLRSGTTATLGETSDVIASAARGLAQTYGKELATAMDPMIAQMIEKVKPAVKEVLRENVPTFAAVGAGTIALSILLGVFISTQVFKYRGGK
jgi:cytosine/adenosine deaminase-related metal-dependent hydrolase